ncbi:hypothetical protein ABKN59_008461 [Abortiporus biennis]
MHLRGLTLKIIFSSVGNAEKLIPVGAAHHTLLLRGQAVLPNLQEIVLDYIPPLNPSLACISRPFRNVSKLSIQYTSFATLLDLRRIINNFFPNLQHLILDNPRFTSQSLQVIPPSSKATGTSLTTLNLIINGDQFAPLRSWLPSTNTRTTLKILNLRIGGGYVDRFTVQPLLLDCGSNVRELRVRWSQDTDVDPNGILMSIGLHVLPVLEILRFELHEAELMTLCTILSEKLSPLLATIALRVFAFKPEQAVKETWAALDETLTHPQLSHVKQFHFSCFDGNREIYINLDGVWTKQLLPKLTAKSPVRDGEEVWSD